jgi:hypothetical protein
MEMYGRAPTTAIDRHWHARQRQGAREVAESQQRGCRNRYLPACRRRAQSLRSCSQRAIIIITNHQDGDGAAVSTSAMTPREILFSRPAAPRPPASARSAAHRNKSRRPASSPFRSSLRNGSGEVPGAHARVCQGQNGKTYRAVAGSRATRLEGSLLRRYCCTGNSNQ